MSVISLSSEDEVNYFTIDVDDESDTSQHPENFGGALSEDHGHFEEEEADPFLEDPAVLCGKEELPLPTSDRNATVSVVDLEEILAQEYMSECRNVESVNSPSKEARNQSDSANLQSLGIPDCMDDATVEGKESNELSQSGLSSKMLLLASELAQAMGIEEPTDYHTTSDKLTSHIFPLVTEDLGDTTYGVDNFNDQDPIKIKQKVERLESVKEMQSRTKKELVGNEKKTRGRKKGYRKYPQTTSGYSLTTNDHKESICDINNSDFQHSTNGDHIDMEFVDNHQSSTMVDTKEVEKGRRGRKKGWRKYPKITNGHSLITNNHKEFVCDINDSDFQYSTNSGQIPIELNDKKVEKKRCGRKKGWRKYPETNITTDQQPKIHEFKFKTKHIEEQKVAKTSQTLLESSTRCQNNLMEGSTVTLVNEKKNRGRKKGWRKNIQNADTNSKQNLSVSQLVDLKKGIFTSSIKSNKVIKRNEKEESVLRPKCVKLEERPILKKNDIIQQTRMVNIGWKKKILEKESIPQNEPSNKCRKRKINFFDDDKFFSNENIERKIQSSEEYTFREKTGPHNKKVKPLVCEEDINVHVNIKVTNKPTIVNTETILNVKDSSRNLNYSANEDKEGQRKSILQPVRYETALSNEINCSLRVKTVIHQTKKVSSDDQNTKCSSMALDKILNETYIADNNKNNSFGVVDCLHSDNTDNKPAQLINPILEREPPPHEHLRFIKTDKITKITNIIRAANSVEGGTISKRDLMKYLHEDYRDHIKHSGVTRSIIASIGKDLENFSFPRSKYVESYNIVFDDEVEFVCMKMGDILHLSLNEFNNLILRLDTTKKLTCDELKGKEVSFALEHYVETLAQYKKTFQNFFSKIYNKIFNNIVIVSDYPEYRRLMLLTWYMKLFLRISTLSPDMFDALEDTRVFLVKGLLPDVFDQFPLVEEVLENRSSEFERECWLVLDFMQDCYKMDTTMEPKMNNDGVREDKKTVESAMDDISLNIEQHYGTPNSNGSYKTLATQEERIKSAYQDKYISAQYSSTLCRSTRGAFSPLIVLNHIERSHEKTSASNTSVNPSHSRQSTEVDETTDNHNMSVINKESDFTTATEKFNTTDHTVNLGHVQRSEHRMSNSCEARSSNISGHVSESNGTYPYADGRLSNFSASNYQKRKKLSNICQVGLHNVTGPMQNRVGEFRGQTILNGSPYADGSVVCNNTVNNFDPKTVLQIMSLSNNEFKGGSTCTKINPNCHPLINCRSSEIWVPPVTYPVIHTRGSYIPVCKKSGKQNGPLEYSKPNAQNFRHLLYRPYTTNTSQLRQLDTPTRRFMPSTPMNHVPNRVPPRFVHHNGYETFSHRGQMMRLDNQHRLGYKQNAIDAGSFQNRYQNKFVQSPAIPVTCQRVSPSNYSSHLVYPGCSNVHSTPSTNATMTSSDRLTQSQLHIKHHLRMLYGQELYEQFMTSQSQRDYSGWVSDKPCLPRDNISGTQELSVGSSHINDFTTAAQRHFSQDHPLDYSKKVPLSTPHQQPLQEARANGFRFP